ncbi:uncharacterized protein LOC116846993 isoform X3 [Odontomachus brunneus]|uniref:uncharacterized protein LOC116846993 isoform X3 n=1 Tax=Odontomachus brunneus TaxID=486640 RepID=UPI0013F23B08|nr:uncharacterized protein LOC116846993 isoform X3 [Odontomachus brunneus]
MPAARATTVGRSFVGYLAALCIVSLTSGLAQVEGRKCACTSRACREMGVDVCSTKFSCYTEFILTAGQGADESTTTRGCTESATPLLCETKSWATRSRSVSNVEPSASPWVRVPWPRLKCCNSHDYCNAADGSDASTWTPERRKVSEEQPLYNEQCKLIANASLDYIMIPWNNCGLSFDGNRMNENIGITGYRGGGPKRATSAA